MKEWLQKTFPLITAFFAGIADAKLNVDETAKEVVLSEAHLTQIETKLAENVTLTQQIADANSKATDAEKNLATAKTEASNLQAQMNALNTKIAAMASYCIAEAGATSMDTLNNVNSKLEEWGKKSGTSSTNAFVKEEKVEAGQTAQQTIDNLPHNQRVDKHSPSHKTKEEEGK